MGGHLFLGRDLERPKGSPINQARHLGRRRRGKASAQQGQEAQSDPQAYHGEETDPIDLTQDTLFHRSSFTGLGGCDEGCGVGTSTTTIPGGHVAICVDLGFKALGRRHPFFP
jgi:hypothetical protein